ncbi:MAG: cyclic nucleotide-binding domain-containing protein [Ignavibacteriales bacterium]|nr:cyclic nucleotide-binding domain-containing protein [Ignavibacteriales bacterium]
MTLNKKTFDLLKKNKIFEGISIDRTGIDFSQEGVKIFKEGDIIFQRGDQPEFMYLIVQGKVKIKFSERNILLNKSDFDFFGEKEITDNTQRISSAVADTNCTVYCIAPQLVNKLLAGGTTISDNVLLNNLKSESTDIFNSLNPDQILEPEPELELEPEPNLELDLELEPELEIDTPPSPDLVEKIDDEIIAEGSDEAFLNNRDEEIRSSLVIDEDIFDDNQGRDLFEIQNKIEEKISESSDKSQPEEIKIEQAIVENIVINDYDTDRVDREKRYVTFIKYNFDSIQQVFNTDIETESENIRNIAISLAFLSKNIISSTKKLFTHTQFFNSEIQLVEDLLNNSLPTIKEAISRSDIKILKKIKAEKSVKINLADFSVACYQIIKNAYEAMPLGGNVFISADEFEDNIEIKIKDEGNGIPEYQLENIFDEFFTHGKNNSVGLGLYLAKKIIEDCGGSISAESDLGESTTIIIKLPIS